MTERRVRRREVRREGTDALLFDWTPKVGDGFVAWLDARCGCAESPEFGTLGHRCDPGF